MVENRPDWSMLEAAVGDLLDPPGDDLILPLANAVTGDYVGYTQVGLLRAGLGGQTNILTDAPNITGSDASIIADPSKVGVELKVKYLTPGTGMDAFTVDADSITFNVDIGTTSGTVAAGDDSRIVGALQAAATDVSSAGFVLDEDDMASDSNTKVPTQQSVKAYVDSATGGVSQDAYKTIVAGSDTIVASGADDTVIFESGGNLTITGSSSPDKVIITGPSPTAATAAGADTQVQFNDSGALGASSNLTWSGTALGITGNITVSGTVDGRDIATDGSTLDTLDTDAQRVLAEGAFVDGDKTKLDGLTNIATLGDVPDVTFSGLADGDIVRRGASAFENEAPVEATSDLITNASTVTGETVTAALDDHEGRIDTLEAAPSGGGSNAIEGAIRTTGNVTSTALLQAFETETETSLRFLSGTITQDTTISAPPDTNITDGRFVWVRNSTGYNVIIDNTNILLQDFNTNATPASVTIATGTKLKLRLLKGATPRFYYET